MGLISLRCPSCGAEVVFSGDVIGHCPYCDSQLHFDDLADKVELERLREENEEYERQEAMEDAYEKNLKNWKHGSVAFLVMLILLTIAGFLIITFSKVYAGVIPLLAATGLFFFVPPIMGALYPAPVIDGATAKNAGKKVGVTFALYAIGFFAFIAAIVIAAMIAVGAGYESKSDKKDETAAVRYSDDCDMMVDRWNKVSFSVDTDDIMEYYSLQAPDSIWRRDKDSEDTALMVEYQKAHMKVIVDNMKIKTKEVERLNELSDRELLGAEAYFRERFDHDAAVMQGYEYHMLFSAESKNTGETEEHDDFVCVVKLRGDGWKIIPEDVSYLRNMAGTDK